MNSKNLRINNDITASEVRLVLSDGEQSVVSIKEALEKAESLGFDLVELSPNAKPPVCRMMNYNKYKFEKEKKQKEAKKKQKVIKLKEVRMQPKIEKHDLDFKSKRIGEFLAEGNQVKVTVRFKGRELAYTEIGRRVLEKVLEILEGQCKLESAPKMEGRMMNMMLKPLNPKK